MGPTIGVFLPRPLGIDGVSRFLDSTRPVTGELFYQGYDTYDFLLSARLYLLTIDENLKEVEADEILALEESGVHAAVDVGVAAMCNELEDHINIGKVAHHVAMEYDAWIHFNSCLRGPFLPTAPRLRSSGGSVDPYEGRHLRIRSRLTGCEFDIADARFMGWWLGHKNYSLP